MGRWVPDDLSQVPLLDRECHPSPAHPLSVTPPFLSRGHPIHPLGAGATAPGQSRTSQPHLSPCDHCPFSLPQFHVRDEPGGRAASQAAREPPRTPPRVLQQGAVSGRMPATPPAGTWCTPGREAPPSAWLLRGPELKDPHQPGESAAPSSTAGWARHPRRPLTSESWDKEQKWPSCSFYDNCFLKDNSPALTSSF